MRALELLDEEAYHGGDPFTGVAFTARDHVVYDARRFEEGREVGAYLNPYFEVTERTPRVVAGHPDLTGNPEFDELVRLRGDLFDGVLYEFDGDQCVRETRVEDGIARVEVAWHTNGVLAAYLYFWEGTAAEFYWNPGAERTALRLLHPEGAEVELKFAFGGLLTQLSSRGDYFAEKSDAALDGLPFRAVATPEGFADVTAAAALSVRGPSATDEVLETLSLGRGLEGCDAFEALDTAITARSVKLLGSLELLKKIEVRGGGRAMLLALTALKSDRPELVVIHDGRAI